jgi:hypothetical protein
MAAPPGSPSEEPEATEHHGKWKRKRRSLWRRIFRRSVLVALAAIGAALVLLYFLIHNIGTYKEPD